MQKLHLAQRLGLVDELVAAVVACARVALAVLVGHDAADSVHDAGACKVLAGDELQALWHAWWQHKMSIILMHHDTFTPILPRHMAVISCVAVLLLGAFAAEAESARCMELWRQCSSAHLPLPVLLLLDDGEQLRVHLLQVLVERLGPLQMHGGKAAD